MPFFSNEHVLEMDDRSKKDAPLLAVATRLAATTSETCKSEMRSKPPLLSKMDPAVPMVTELRSICTVMGPKKLSVAFCCTTKSLVKSYRVCARTQYSKKKGEKRHVAV
jgi:hypothetical protein